MGISRIHIYNSMVDRKTYASVEKDIEFKKEFENSCSYSPAATISRSKSVSSSSYSSKRSSDSCDINQRPLVTSESKKTSKNWHNGSNTQRCKSSTERKSGATRLHVGSLSRNVTEEHIREIFQTFGKLHKTEMQVDQTTHVNRGYAFVEYDSHIEAERARFYMDGAQIDGKYVQVKYAHMHRRAVHP